LEDERIKSDYYVDAVNNFIDNYRNRNANIPAHIETGIEK